MTISLVSDITLEVSSQLNSCVIDKHNTKYNTPISEQPYIHARWSIFTFPGRNEPRPGHGTPSVGQFRDDPGHSGTVGKPSNGVCGDITLMYTSTTTLTASLYD